MANFDTLKDLLKRDVTASRPSFVPFQDIRPGTEIKGVLDKENSEWLPGLIFARGKPWSDQRRFTLRVLKDFGFGKASMESTLLDELDKLCEELKRCCDKAIDIKTKMNISILNSLWSILTGQKLQLDDPKLQNILDRSNAFLASANPSSALASMLPSPHMFRWSICKPLRDALGLDLNSIKACVDGMVEIIEDQIKHHKSHFDPGCINDFLDSYIAEMARNKENEHSSFYKERGHYYLVNVMIDLFLAGMETTASALNWSFLLLLHHPGIKRKIQKEIDEVQMIRK